MSFYYLADQRKGCNEPFIPFLHLAQGSNLKWKSAKKSILKCDTSATDSVSPLEREFLQ